MDNWENNSKGRSSILQGRKMLPSKTQVVVTDEKVEKDIVIPVPVHRLLTAIA